MLNGLYSAATAMDSSATRHEVVAQNLAYADHPGYRRRVVLDGTFESVLDEAQQSRYARESLGTTRPESRIDFSPGLRQQTGRSLDLALQGDGFFAVDGPDGPLYTRSGVFELNSEGTLVTVDGLTVRGAGGSITVPPEASSEQLTVTADGRFVMGDQVLGQLELVQFDRTDLLIPAGVSLFEAPDDLESQTSEATVMQGSRERSNVSPVLEMVRMIDGMRQYEAASRALQAIAEAIEKNVTPRG